MTAIQFTTIMWTIVFFTSPSMEDGVMPSMPTAIWLVLLLATAFEFVWREWARLKSRV
jgi:hypothetical protein